MTFPYSYPGWNVETTHDIELDPPCAESIEPTIKLAADWGSVAHQHQFTDSNGDVHTIVVRQVVEEPPVEP
jgi:hypothetical protein